VGGISRIVNLAFTAFIILTFFNPFSLFIPRVPFYGGFGYGGGFGFSPFGYGGSNTVII